MANFLLIAAGVLAVLDWVAVARKIRKLEYIAKPGVMVALLLWLGSLGGFSGQMLWFALGLFLSLWGDIFLMLPKEQLLAGLLAFLGAHLFYLVGFNATLPPANLPATVMAVGVGITTARLYRGIAAGMAASRQNSLKTPVLAYFAMISLMLLSGLLTLVRVEWETGAALLASGGALLFYLSDAILAWNRFVKPQSSSSLVVMITYHIGQALIVLGAAQQYLL